MAKGGQGGIEPPTSPTLRENHATRPLAHQMWVTKKGTTGIEPVTAGSAIPCSTAELSTLRIYSKQSQNLVTPAGACTQHDPSVLRSQVKDCMGHDFFTTCYRGENRLHAQTSWAGTAPTAGLITPKSTSSGDRTHDHKIKSLALYHLSYGGPTMGTCGGPVQVRWAPLGPPGAKSIHNPGIEPGTFCV